MPEEPGPSGEVAGQRELLSRHEGNHPGYALGCWLREYKEQVFLFTRHFAVDWTTNVAERGAKAAKRHQFVSGYWHSLATLARWCRIRSYLDSAAATASPHSTPSATHSPENPGYRHCPPSADTNSQPP